MTTAVITPNNKQFPKEKLVLGLAIAAMVMLFAGLTSAYIVRQKAGNWEFFKMPPIFWFNTVIILLSSLTMHWAVRSYKQFKYNAYRIAMLFTTMLGVTFLVGQYLGWTYYLPKAAITLTHNASGSFLYVISMTHALHVLGGVLALVVITLIALLKPYNPNKYLRVQLMSVYWHFVDILWIYLFIFFQIKF